MKDQQTGLDAWSPRAMAEAIGLDPLGVEQLLDQTVGEGLAVRVSQGRSSWYIPGDLREVLSDLGVTPVEGDRLAERTRYAREVAARARARALTERDSKGA